MRSLPGTNGSSGSYKQGLLPTDLKLDKLIAPVASYLISKRVPALNDGGFMVYESSARGCQYQNPMDMQQQLLYDAQYIRCRDTSIAHFDKSKESLNAGVYYLTDKAKGVFESNSVPTINVGGYDLPQLAVKVAYHVSVINNTSGVIDNTESVPFHVEVVPIPIWRKMLQEGGVMQDFEKAARIHAENYRGMARFTKHADGIWECLNAERMN
jgi:hypothetical protein